MTPPLQFRHLMKTSKFLLLLSVFAFLGLAQNAQSQSVGVDYNSDAQALAEQISGNGVQLLNVVLTCADSASGVYTVQSVTGFPEGSGVILSTGDVGDMRGPNLSESTTTEWTTPGDPLITQISGQSSFDGCALEFDIIPAGDTLKFDFTFASEEYSEYVGTPFNDAFGFFIKGPGIPGDPALDDFENIAIIPGTSDAVEINTVNGGNPDIGFLPVNEQFYNDNPLGFSNIIQYDGWTTDLFASRVVTPCDTFRLKLVIADVGDRKWDSAVMIEEIESPNTRLDLVTVGGIEDLIEGCNDGTVTFTREPISDQDLVVTYFLQGTAINGTDYALIGGDPDPNVPKTITIPANQGSASIDFFPFDDGIPEGPETVEIYIGNPNCVGTIQDSLIFLIEDELELSVDPLLAFICLGDSLTFSVEGPGSDFSWSPPIFLNDPSIKEPTTTPTVNTIYTVTSTVSTCTAEATSEINVTDVVLSATVTQIICGGTNTGAIDLNVTGGQSPIEFSWIGPNGFSAITEDITDLAPGIYAVLVTDRDGCTANYSVEITEIPALVATLNSPVFQGGDNISCFAASDGQITANVTGGLAPFDFEWDDPLIQTTQTAINLAAGTYTVIVTDANNCTTSQSITITQPVGITGTLVNRINVLCAGESTGSALVQAIGGHAPYGYEWNTIPPQFGPIATGLPAGVYTVDITDVNNCSGTTVVEIEEPDAPLTGNVETTNPICFGDLTGEAIAHISGGVLPYIYAWNAPTSPNDSINSGLGAGNYSMTVTDFNNCSITIPFNITEPTELNLTNVSQTNVLCNGGLGSVTVSASGGTPDYTFGWDTNPAVTTPNLDDVTAGTYTVIATDANGCADTLVIEITEPAALDISITEIILPLCHDTEDGSITVLAVGGASPLAYEWNTIPPTAGPILSGVGSGTYEVTVSDDNGCEETLSIPLIAPDPILISVISVTNVLCAGEATGEATISVSGGTPNYDIVWTDPLNQNGETATGLLAGTYTVNVTDDNGCMASIDITITEPASPLQASITANQDVDCFGTASGSATVTASGGSGSYSYQWDDPNNQQTATATNLGPGTYTVTVTDNNGCTIPVVLTIEIFSPAEALSITLTPSLFNGFNLSCAGDASGAIDLDITGGTANYDILWNLPGTGTSTDQNLSNLDAGTYQVLVTDANGCTAEATIILTEPTPISITATTTPSLCFGAATGTLSIIIDGGVPTYDVLWNGPNGFTSDQLDLVNIEGGIYNLTITDANGCVYIDAVTVIQPDDIIITVDSLSNYNGFNTTCWNSNDGEIYISPNGGTLPYVIQWNTPGNPNFSNQEDVTSLFPGSYEVVITDDNGCIQSEQFDLTSPDTIDVGFNASLFPNGFNISCFGANDGSIEALASGGTPDYNYIWLGPNGFGPTTDNPIINLEPGEYSILVTDAQNCIQTSTITLIAPDEFQIDLVATVYNGNNISCNGGSDGAIDLILDGGEPTFTYSWTGPNGFTANTQNLTLLEAGDYCVDVTDGLDCIASQCITLTEPNAQDITLTPFVYPNGFNLSCAGATDGSIDAESLGGTGPFSFQWSGPNNFTANTEDIAGLEEGNYCLTITDGNNCTQTECVDILAPPSIEILADNISAPSCAGGTDGSIEITPQDGVAPFTFIWSGPNSYTSSDEDIFGLEPGTYCVLATDANSCIGEACFNVNNADSLLAVITAVQFEGGFQIQCNGTATGSITAAATGGVGPFTYAWTGPNGFTANGGNINNLEAGEYCLTLEDTNNCIYNECIELTEPAELISNAVVTLPTCGDGNLATIDLNMSGGAEPYTFNWNTDDDTEVIVVGDGDYTVIITDANGCEITESFNIVLPLPIIPILESPSIAGFNLTCNGDFSGAINMTVFNGVGTLQPSWTGPNGFTSVASNLTGLEAGEYCVTITDDLGCTGTSCLTIIEPDTISIVFAPTAVSCDGGSDGSVIVNVSGGVPTYQISWTGPNGFTGVGPELTGLEVGNYCATVTDQNGCIQISCFDLTAPDPIDIVLTSPEVSGVNILCFGDNSGVINALISGGVSPYSFVWIGPNGYSSSDLDLINLFAGEYCLTVTDSNNCQSTACITLTESDGIDFDIDVFEFANGFNTSCGDICDGSLTAVITGGLAPITVAWQGPNGFTSDQLILDNLCAGTYNIQTTDDNGCQQDTSFTLTEPEPITIDLDSPEFSGGFEISCFGTNTGTILMTITGGIGTLDFSWTGPNGFVSDQEDLFNLFAGTYDVTVTDENGCEQTASITLEEPAESLTALADAFDFPSGNQISCVGANDGSITSAASGGTPTYTYNWNGPNGFTSNDQDLDNLEPGLYVLVVEDANNCVFTIELTLTEPLEALTASQNIIQEIQCAGDATGSITVTPEGGSPGYEIDWTGPDGFTANTLDLDGLVAGTYNYTVTDINGCDFTGSYTFTEPQPITVSAQITDANCITPTGIIDLTVSGGAGPYDYLWNTTDTSQDLVNVLPGTYTVDIEDNNGCTVSESFTVGSFSSLDVTALITDLSCFEDTTGAINLEINVGTPPFDVSWTGPNGFSAQTEAIENLMAGEYSMDMTDQNGCTFSATYTVGQPDALVIEDLFSPVYQNGKNLSGFQSGDGVIETPQVNGGIEEYDFQWTSDLGYTSTSELNQLDLDADTYYLLVTDANGCTDSTFITLTEPIPFEIPNGISPNGDGFNDGLEIRGLEDYPVNKLIIFNRWGNIVFEENNYSNNDLWYGTNQDGKQLAEGTYFIVIEAEGTDNLKGYLELRR